MPLKNIKQNIVSSLPSTLVEKIKSFTLPGFDKQPLYSVGKFFVQSLNKGALTVRASSIAYNLFLAIFPALIFFFSLIAYIPIDNLPQELLRILQDVMPTNAYLSIRSTILDTVMNKRTGLLSFGFITALYFSTNGINALIAAFNASQFVTESRNWLQCRGISLILLFLLSVLLTLAIGLLVFSQKAFGYLISHEIIKENIIYYLIVFGKWLIVILAFFFAISLLYYLAPARKSKFRFISAGSSLATILCMVISLGFSYYVNHFGQYNKIYGSIGTLIVLLIWLYFNALVLLIGYELNWSIRNSKHSNHFLLADNSIDNDNLKQ
jgi:membrane protein